MGSAAGNVDCACTHQKRILKIQKVVGVKLDSMLVGTKRLFWEYKN